MNIKEAAQKWIEGFNGIPQSLIIKAYQDNMDDVQELTPIVVGDTVWSDDFQETAEVTQYNSKNNTYEIICSDGTIESSIDRSSLSPDYDSQFPMWGWMWTFGECIDTEWAKEHLYEMAECGFRIYESEELDLFFGIDGAGYDFLSEHFIPLYKVRGLKWHTEE